MVQIDSLDVVDAKVGNVISTGTARFLNPVYAELANSQNINAVTSTNSIASRDTIIISSGNTLKRISFANFCAAVSNAINN